MRATHEGAARSAPPHQRFRRFASGALLLTVAIVTGAAVAAAPPTAQVNTTQLAVTDNEVIVGSIRSLTGTIAIVESSGGEAHRIAL
jgi:urea transport system substrate-binding protein